MSPLARPVAAESAQVVGVFEEAAGAVLVAPLLIAATDLDLDDVTDFSEDGGNLYLQSAIDGELTSDEVAYTAADRDLNRITLTAAWPSSAVEYAIGDAVWVSPLATEQRAEVAIDGDTEQTVEARIPYALSAQIPAGTRPVEGGEWVRIAPTVMGYEVVDVERRYPDVDPAAVVISDPSTGEETGVISSDSAFDSVTADVVSSPSVPRRSDDDLLVYVDPVNGLDTNSGTALPPLIDTFTRTVAGSWGTAESGQAYTTLANSFANPVEVDGTRARFRLNGASLRATIRSSFAALNANAEATFHFLTQPTGGTHWVGLAARVQGAGDFYYAGLSLTSGGVLSLVIGDAVGGVYTDRATAVLMSPYTLATFHKVKFQVLTGTDGGTILRAKAWLPSVDEPDAWQMEYVSYLGGGVATPYGWGTFARTGAGATGGTQSYWDELSFVSIDTEGNVVDVSEGGVGPIATLGHALELIGEWNDGEIRIVCVGDIEEAIDVPGLAGGGRVIIDGGGVAVLWGFVRLYGVNQYFELRDFSIQDTGEPGIAVVATVTARTSRHIELINLKITTNNLRVYSVSFTEGSEGRLEGCQLDRALTSAVQVAEGSMVYANDNKGESLGGIDSYRSAASYLFINGTRPQGATATTLAGRIDGSAVATSGTAIAMWGGGSARTTEIIAPTASRSFGGAPTNERRKDQDDVYQGGEGWYRGCAFYQTRTRRAGKTCDKLEVYVHRNAEGGKPEAQGIFAVVHDLEEQPAGNTGPTILLGPLKIGELAWGNGRWFTLPKAWGDSLMTGTGRGVGLMRGAVEPFLRCAGVRQRPASAFHLKITYH